MGTTLLALAGILVGTTAALLSACLRLRSAIGFLLALYLFGCAELVGVALALSPAQWLTRGTLLMVLTAVLVGAVVIWAGMGRPSPPLCGVVPAVRDALSDRAVLVLAIAAAAVQTYVLLIGLVIPQSLPDTLLYHLPRAALWKQQHAVAYVPHVADERVNVFPPNAEIQVAVTMVLSRGDRYVSLVQFAALVASCIAIYGVARRIALPRSAAAFGGLIFATFTVVVLQAPTALNDLAVAALLIIAAYFGMASRRTEFALMALALALAVGTKGTVVFALPALALFLLTAQPRRRWIELTAFGLVGLVAGSVWLLVNLAETGHVSGGARLGQGTAPLLDRVRLSFMDLLELSDLDATGFLESPAWGVGALVIALVVAGALAARKRMRGSCVALVAGAVAFLAAPLLVTWAEVAGRVAGRALATLGYDRFGPATRLPVGYAETAMHSSFGLAFVGLLIAVAVIVASEVVRRQLQVAYLVALFGVPLTVAVTALALSYDSQRMRYIVFSAALAASVFGVALRVRPLTWGAVGATIVSLSILVGYFIPRPANLSVFAGNRTTERGERWYIQAEGGAGDPDAFRFLAEEVPGDANVALDLASNTYIYPAWDAQLRRKISFVRSGVPAPGDATWLVVGPSRPVDERRLEDEGWELELVSPGDWRIYGR